MKNKFLTHKLLPVLSVLFLVLTLFCTSAFAMTTVVDGKEFIVKDEVLEVYPYYLLASYDDEAYHLIVSTSPISIGTVVDGVETYYAYYGSNLQYSFSAFDGVNNYSFSPVYSGITRVMKIASTGERFVKSANHDIYDIDNNLVFQGAPQEEQEEVKPVELAPLMTSINFSGIMAEVLGILPILLVVVIGLLALRKAIKLVLQMLQKA